jgi:hypothetical protein
MTYLTSGPITTTPERRQALIESMADHLLGLGPIDDDDAIRSLVFSMKYQPSEVETLFEAVKYEAAQRIVAREMSDG